MPELPKILNRAVDWVKNNPDDAHSFVKLIESTIAIGLLFLHSGEMLLMSNKEFKLGYVTGFTAFPVFLLARLTAAGWRCKWIPLIIDVIFLGVGCITYFYVLLFVAADLPKSSSLRNLLRLENQIVKLNPEITIVRIVFLALLVAILLLDAVFQLVPGILDVYCSSPKRK